MRRYVLGFIEASVNAGCGWGWYPWRSWTQLRCCACQWLWWSGGRGCSWVPAARWRTCPAQRPAPAPASEGPPCTRDSTSGCLSPGSPPYSPGGPICLKTILLIFLGNLHDSLWCQICFWLLKVDWLLWNIK